MNVYDFDDTIYAGDSTLDFYFFCLKKNLVLLKYFPLQIKGFILYKLKKIEKTAFKEIFFAFLRGETAIIERVEQFWDEKETKIKPWYLAQKETSDLIISASPEFLLKPICKRLEIEHLIASKVDEKTGRFYSPNCYGVEKVQRFQKVFPDGEVHQFYSDSCSDLPMANLAKEAFLVKKDNCVRWGKNRNENF